MSSNDEDHPTSPPPPPWERGTGAGKPASGNFGATQPIEPPTAEDVLEVFGRFQQSLLQRIDVRDENILRAIQDIGTDILAHHERETKRGDEHDRSLREHNRIIEDHDRLIKHIRQRTHKLSSEQQATNLRLVEIERRLGIQPPLSAQPEPEIDPKPEIAPIDPKPEIVSEPET